MQSFKSFLNEELLNEHILSIGINPKHEKFREQHRKEMHDILHKSYAKIGGYGGHGSGTQAEHEAIHKDISNNVIKATRRNGKITAVNLYRKQSGRKSIGSGTDGTEQGKKDWKKTSLEDHEQKRAWGEVSGATEHLKRKMGWPVVPSSRAHKLLKKPIRVHPDGEHYDRDIGGHSHTKVILGHPKEDN